MILPKVNIDLTNRKVISIDRNDTSMSSITKLSLPSAIAAFAII